VSAYPPGPAAGGRTAAAAVPAIPSSPPAGAGPPAAELDLVTAAWLKAARVAAAEIARLQEVKERAIGHVKEALGDAEEGTIEGRPAVTWAWSKPGQRLDRKKLEGDFGADVIAAYLVGNQPARPFRILDEEGQ
jgi:hypothetical protein